MNCLILDSPPLLESPLMARIFTIGLRCCTMLARMAPSRLGMLMSVTTTLISLLREAKSATASEPSPAINTR